MVNLGMCPNHDGSLEMQIFSALNINTPFRMQAWRCALTPLTSRDVTIPAHIGRRILQPATILDASISGCATFGSLSRFGNGIRVFRVRSHGFQHNEDPGFPRDAGFRTTAHRRRTREWQKGIDGKVISTFEHPRRLQQSYEERTGRKALENCLC
jgi:hypothetical protein